MKLVVLLTLSDKFSTIWCKYRHWNCTILLPSVHLSSVLSNLVSLTSQKKTPVHSSWRLTNLYLLSKILEMSVCRTRQQSKKSEFFTEWDSSLTIRQVNQTMVNYVQPLQHQRRNKSTIQFCSLLPWNP